MKVLAIDPGTTQSGYVLYDGSVITSGVMDNDELLQVVRDDRSDCLSIEQIVSYGKAVGVASHAWAALGVALVAMKRITGGSTAANEGV